jgi:AcrR family transcriptional regulator
MVSTAVIDFRAAAGNRAEQRLVKMYAIERAAMTLFVERGFDAVTAEQIAEAAGVSVRTYFRYFPEGNEGVMLLETRRGMDFLRKALRKRPPQEPALAALRAAVIDTFGRPDARAPADDDYGQEQAMALFGQIAERHPGLLARMMGERQVLMESLVHEVALRMSADPDTDLRPRLLVHNTHAVMTAAWLSAYRNPSLDHEALLNQAFDLLEFGMAPSPGALRAGSSS